MSNNPLNEHEQYCLDNASYFNVFRVRPRLRQKCASLIEAEAVAAAYGDGRTMIYAVTDNGRDAHIKNN